MKIDNKLFYKVNTRMYLGNALDRVNDIMEGLGKKGSI
jgi:NAD/NADP transhydrogenase beta subunit